MGVSTKSHLRAEVVIVVPPNSNTVIDGRLLTVTKPSEHSDWSDFLCLGALSLASALKAVPTVRPVYIDGTIINLSEVLRYISDNHSRILAVCAGVLTANYEAGVMILDHAKAVDAGITTIVGSDHFTALPSECMRYGKSIDYGFFGNEIIASFTSLIADLAGGVLVRSERYAGLVSRSDGRVVFTPPAATEPVFSHYEYGLIDVAFLHSAKYTEQFAHRIAPRVKELLGRTVRAGVPVELGRGCIKFAKNDACSFCSIQYGSLWKNQLTPEAAWATISSAWDHGYDYMYVTADELPLTFGALLSAMTDSPPAWWQALAADERPVLVGYARADGIADGRRTEVMVDLGIRQVMIGMDAGAAVSLAAMNKPLHGGRKDLMRQAEVLYEQNSRAIQVARDNGMMIRAGFVVGHIGMTESLLEENLERIFSLISTGRDAFSAVDVEVLSPQPGSFDFTYLTDPDAAESAAARVGLTIADRATRDRVAANWADRDVIPPELAMRDFATALMPELDFDQLAQARSSIRQYAKASGITIGE